MVAISKVQCEGCVSFVVHNMKEQSLISILHLIFPAKLSLADYNKCIYGLADDASPTIFLQIVAEDPSYSLYEGNDFVKWPIDKSRIVCPTGKICRRRLDC